MCGIAGYWRVTNNAAGTPLSIEACARRMSERLAHRGPDSSGVWADADAGLALGHRRLAVMDISAQGHQPMRSPCGRYMGVFNGEIYNFRALRKELNKRGLRFAGHCDTEVLLAAVGAWGLRPAVERFDGMFAFALWDREQRRLHLARDRLGQKPLYFGWVGSAFVFGSELKAFKVLPEFSHALCDRALAAYLQLSYVPAPRCIYRGLYKLSPGTMLSIDRADAARPRDPEPLTHAYWSAPAQARAAASQPWTGSDAEAVDELEACLGAATDRRMAADVPLGAFLSGGIDSSLVVALMQARTARPVQTYAVGFGSAANSETDDAKAVARYLGTEHTELHITGDDAVATVPELPHIVDEPLGDFAQVPNYLIARAARRHITVALSGDGGDEFFGGYKRYPATLARWRRLARMPSGVRRLLRLTARARRGPARLGAASIDELYFYKMCRWTAPNSLLLGAGQTESAFADGSKWPGVADPLQRLLLLDVVYYLANVILTKVDRTSMASSLEVRSPLLDHHVAQWSWRLSSDKKIRDGAGKWILRELLARYLPRRLFERPKRGFGAPIGRWLAGPLHEWAEDLLAPERLARQGMLNPGPVRRLWNAQLYHKAAWQKQMWTLLMLAAWRDTHG